MQEITEITKNINNIISRRDDKVIILKNICNEIGQKLKCGILLIDTKGKIVSFSNKSNLSFLEIAILEIEKVKFISEVFKNALYDNSDITSLFNSNDNIFTLAEPLINNGERIGNVIFFRDNTPFDEKDLTVIEIFKIIGSLTLIQVLMEENAEMERSKNIVKSAISTFSYSELEAIVHLFNALDGTEGIIIASKVADEVGITRSVIVNAIRKFESAGVIESRSLGMKGTYIKMLNKYLPSELDLIKDKFIAFR